MVQLGELVMILDLPRQGLSVTAIARQLNLDRKTVRKYIARGLEPPAYKPRPPREQHLDPFIAYLRERVAAYPALTGSRLWRVFDAWPSAITRAPAAWTAAPPAPPRGAFPFVRAIAAASCSSIKGS
ncbi:hypothetical protein SAMN02799622_05857 [Methylobacterium sp. UNC378MF]|nr:hypothetical protein SAMN02799622_05857 [Methylobacterium sp. UNC378MF]